MGKEWRHAHETRGCERRPGVWGAANGMETAGGEESGGRPEGARRRSPKKENIARGGITHLSLTDTIGRKLQEVAVKVGVLGSGGVATTLASGFLKHGHQVMLGSRTPEKLKDWVAANT